MNKTFFKFVGPHHIAMLAEWFEANNMSTTSTQDQVTFVRDSDMYGDICLYKYICPDTFETSCRVTFVGDHPKLVLFKLWFSEYLLTPV